LAVTLLGQVFTRMFAYIENRWPAFTTVLNKYFFGYCAVYQRY